MHFQLTSRAAVQLTSRINQVCVCVVCESPCRPRVMRIPCTCLAQNTVSWDPSVLVLGIMAVPRNQPKLVFRTTRVTCTGQRKLIAWSEYWLRVLPASCKLERHGKRPGRYVWTDLLFTKRISPRLRGPSKESSARSARLTIPCTFVCAIVCLTFAA